jgi:hypothetical protein
MINKSGPWSTPDFDEMSWHDVHVHGFSLENFDDTTGCSDLVLDIDYILEWLNEGAEFRFKVCRAELRFEKVFALKVALDYAASSAGMSPFALSQIRREEITYHTGARGFKWCLEINWPLGGLVEFESPSFKQSLVGEPRYQTGQWLSSEYRII